MAGGVWGESNTNDFLLWADKCQNEAMKSRGLRLDTSVNFNNISHPKAVDAKNTLLDIIEKNRQISVESIYKAMPSNLCANPTTKNLLIQLYYENNLRLESNQTSSGREGSFILHFENRKRKEEKVAQIRNKNVVFKQSNIEDLMDDNWKSSGRRLEFEEKYRDKGSLNISLKKEKPKPKPIVNEKPVMDVRMLMKGVKDEVKKDNTNVAPQPKKVEIPEVKAQPAQVFKPLPEIKLDLPKEEFIPKPQLQEIIEPAPKLRFNHDLEFAGLSCFELYLLEAYFLDASFNTQNKQEKNYLKTNSELCKTKGDILYFEEGNKKSGFVKFLLLILSITIILIPAYIAYSKNKTRTEAKREYNKMRKRVTFEQMTNNLQNKYPRVFKK